MTFMMAAIVASTITYNASDVQEDIKVKAPTAQIEDQPPLKVYGCIDTTCSEEKKPQ
jgi:hypothetical protein